MSRYIYSNRTEEIKIVTLISEARTSCNHLPMSPGSKIELNYPGLDMYVPHCLARLDEAGNDISYVVIKERENKLLELKRAQKDSKSEETKEPSNEVNENKQEEVKVEEDKKPVEIQEEIKIPVEVKVKKSKKEK